MTCDQRSSARVNSFNDLAFAPRFAYPEMCEVCEVAGLQDRSELAGGFARFKAAAIDWQVQYDELILVIEGKLSVDTPDGTLTAGPRDTIWLPKGTKVTYRAQEALVFYALQPASWSSQAAK